MKAHYEATEEPESEVPSTSTAVGNQSPEREMPLLSSETSAGKYYKRKQWQTSRPAALEIATSLENVPHGFIDAPAHSPSPESFKTAMEGDTYSLDGAVSPTLCTPSQLVKSATVPVDDLLTLSTFTRRAVIDFGNVLTAGRTATRYLGLLNVHPYTKTVVCERALPSDEFSTFWMAVDTSAAAAEQDENLADASSPQYALVDMTTPPVCLDSCPSLSLGPHHRCLLRIAWTPIQPTIQPGGPAEVAYRHVMQFRVNNTYVVEAAVVGKVRLATVKKQPRPRARAQKHRETAANQPLADSSNLQMGTFLGSPYVSMKKIAKASQVEQSSQPLKVSELPLLPPPSGRNSPLESPKSVARSFSSTSLDRMVEVMQPPNKVPHSLNSPTVTELRRRVLLKSMSAARQSSHSPRAVSACDPDRGSRLSAGLPDLDSLRLRHSTSLRAGLNFTPKVSDYEADRTPENETAIEASYISPSLLSPILKKDSNLLFNAYSSSGNIFSWDASESLSEASEVGFTRWINHVFLQGMAVRELQPVATGADAGSSSRRARFSEKIMTEAKAAALRLLQSPSFAAPAHRIEREVDARKFRVHPDANLRADKGLQQRVCEIFLAHYSSIWLQLCVETLSTFTAPPPPASVNTSIVCEKSTTTTAIRLQSYLFGAVPPMPKVKLEEEETSSKGKGLNARKPVGWGRSQNAPVTFNDHYNRQIVKRCLVLIWLLDQSRAKRIVRYNPCLFKSKSLIKSSAEILLKFANLCLQGDVNLVRGLSAIGATVSVSQTALDEFDFTVKNLAVDLRDGLRLVKLADLLLEGKASTDHSGINDSGSILAHVGNLMSLVRFPPISRLQKIHNVGIALSAFEAASDGKNLFTAAGKPISERDIVDGHRSKTLSLLWCILLRFQVTALLDLPSLRSEICRLARKHNDVALTQAADAVYNVVGMPESERNQRVLFLWTTAIMQTYGVEVSNLDQSFADGRIFCYILHFYLPTLLPKALVRTPTTLTPDLHSDVPTVMRTRNNLYNLRLFHRKIAHLGDVPTLLNVGPGLFADTAYTCLTSTSRPTTREVTVLSPGIVLATLAYLASRLVRPAADRAQLKRVLRDHAARIIQMAWRASVQSRHLAGRSVLLMKSTPPLRLPMDLPTSTTTAARASLPCRRSSQLSDSDATAATNKSFPSSLSPSQAAVKLQAWYRGCLARRALVLQRQEQAASRIQTAYRSFLRRRKLRALVFDLLERHRAAVPLQAIARGYLARLHCAKLKARRLSAALTLQRAFCAVLEQRRRRRRAAAIRRLHAVALVVLAAVKFSRPVMHRRRQIAAATLIQTRFRSARARKLLMQQRKEVAAATRLQAYARGFLARRLLARRRAEVVAARNRQAAAITIQAHVRGFLMRSQLAHQRRTAAAIVIQAQFRGYRVRTTYRAYREWNAATILQAVARGFLARRRVARLLEERRRNAAAALIQARFRGYRARRAFLNYRLWNAAVLVQAHIRGFLARRKYCSQRLAAVLIQSHVRGYLVRRAFAERRNEAHRQQVAATVIQTAYRNHRVRRIRTAQLEHRAACAIQAYVRGFLARRELFRRREMHRRNVAATLIQARFRGYRARCNLLLHRRTVAAVTIQRWWRQRLVRIWEIRREKAAICIQRSWRAYSLPRWLYRRQQAALVIQAAWRGWKVRTRASVRAHLQVSHVPASDLLRARRRIAMATRRARKNPLQRLGPRARIALADLLKYTSVAQVLEALNNLDTVTRLSKEVCFWLADVNPNDLSSEADTTTTTSRLRQPTDITLASHSSSVFFPHVLLRLLQSCNRSVANEEIVLASLYCLLNMARHRELAARPQIWWRPPPPPSPKAAPRRRSLGDGTGKSQSTAADTRPTLDSTCSSISSDWLALTSSSCIDPTVEHRRDQPHTIIIGSGSDACIADFFFGMLHRLCRARFGTLSVRLFAHIACLLALICTETPSEIIPPHLTAYVEGIFSTVQRLWGPGLAKVGAVTRSGGDCCREPLSRPPEKHLSSASSAGAAVARAQKQDFDRLITHRRELMSFFTKGDRSANHLNPVTACEFLLLTLRQKNTLH
ncbi:hypothetical protein SprV_0702297900 [Sparganum proliferum]